jgi:hypothetical protein
MQEGATIKPKRVREELFFCISKGEKYHLGGRGDMDFRLIY